MASTSTGVDIRALPASVISGAIAGLVAGLPLGFIMLSRDTMPMVADLVADPSTGFGWVVHLFNSALFGAVFGLLFARVATRPAIVVVLGLVYGVAWWVLGALWIMPVWLGMSEMAFEVGADQWWSLVGHMAYGLLLGGLYVLPDLCCAASSEIPCRSAGRTV